MSTPQQPYETKVTTKTQPTTIRKTTRSEDTKITFIIALIINSASSSMMIGQIIHSEHNSVYPTIFILIHNLITYTNLNTNHLKSDKNTITMTKSPTKCLNNQSNQRTSIHHHVKVKCPKKPHQQSSWKTEVTKFNAIMDQLNE